MKQSLDSHTVIIRSNDSPDEFKRFFTMLVRTEPRQGSLYTLEADAFYRAALNENAEIISDISFVVITNGVPAAAVKGYIVRRDGKLVAENLETPVRVISAQNVLHDDLESLILAELKEKLIGKVSAVRFADFHIAGFVSRISKFFAKEYGIGYVPSYFRVINLANSLEEIRSDVRKSYKSLINRGIKELSPFIVDDTNIVVEDMMKMRELHIREAGRETRSYDSWLRLYDMIKVKSSFMVLGTSGEVCMSGGIFFRNQSSCFYGVSASRRDEFDKPLFHALMWRAIEYAKEQGIQYFEIGQDDTYFDGASLSSESKLYAINKFKMGFGGISYPLTRISSE